MTKTSPVVECQNELQPSENGENIWKMIPSNKKNFAQSVVMRCQFVIFWLKWNKKCEIFTADS